MDTPAKHIKRSKESFIPATQAKEADRLYEEAQTSARLGQRDKAYNVLKQCITCNATHSEAHSLLKKLNQILQPVEVRYIRMPLQENEYILFAKPGITIGRQADNDIVILNTDVSRYHARLSIDADMCLIEDLQSSNGTRLNGLKIQKKAMLHDRDIIGIGLNLQLEICLQKRSAGTSLILKPLDAKGVAHRYILFSGAVLLGSANECELPFQTIASNAPPFLFKMSYCPPYWYLHIHPHATDVTFNGISVSEYVIICSGDKLSIAGLTLIFD